MPRTNRAKTCGPHGPHKHALTRQRPRRKKHVGAMGAVVQPQRLMKTMEPRIGRGLHPRPLIFRARWLLSRARRCQKPNAHASHRPCENECAARAAQARADATKNTTTNTCRRNGCDGAAAEAHKNHEAANRRLISTPGARAVTATGASPLNVTAVGGHHGSATAHH